MFDPKDEVFQCCCGQLCESRPIHINGKLITGWSRTTTPVDPRIKLERYLQLLAAERANRRPSGLHILVYTRELLEYLELKEKYATANLYCNLAVHTQIMRSNTAYRLLVRVNDALIKLPNGASPATVDAAVTAQLSLSEFRNELRALYALEGLDAPFFDSWLDWNELNAIMADEWRGKRISFPDGEVDTWNEKHDDKAIVLYRDSRERVKVRFGDASMMIRELKFEVIHRDGIDAPGRGILHWIAVSETGVETRGGLSAFDIWEQSSFRNS